MPYSHDLIPHAVARYHRERDRYSKLADRVAEICRTICEDNAIRAQVTFRVKSVKSFEGKLRRFAEREDRNFSSVDEAFDSIGDLAGVRIATYQHEDCDEIRKLVCADRAFRGVARDEIEIEEKDKNRDNPDNFYRAIHAQVCLSPDALIGIYDNLEDVSCEIQICTMIDHVWNEIEHDIGYKPGPSGPSVEERALLKSLGCTVRSGDTLISLLLAANAKRNNIHEGKFRDVHDFVTRAQEVWDIDNVSRNSGQLFDQLQKLNLNSMQALSDMIRDMPLGKLKEDIGAFNEYLKSQETSLAMDPGSADVLLMALLQRRLKDVMESHLGRVGHGLGAPNRLYRLAKRYRSFEEAGTRSSTQPVSSRRASDV